MDNIVRVNIELEDGTQVQPFHSIRIDQSIANHAYFELRCPMRTFEEDNEPLINKTLDLFGKTIKVVFKIGRDNESTEYFFKALITEISVDKFQGLGGDLLIKGYSPTIILEEGHSYATFMGKTISQSVSEILREVPSNIMGKKVDLDDDKNMGYRVQYKESSFTFLKKIAKVYSQWLYYDGRDLYFGKASDMNPIKLLFGVDISNLKFDLKLIPSHFEFINYNTTSDTVFTSDSSQARDESIDTLSEKVRSASTNTYTKKVREMVSFRPTSQGVLDDVVSIAKKRLDGRYQVISGSTSNPNIKLGTLIEIEGPNRANPQQRDSYGKYRVTALHQEVKGGGNYSCTFEAISAYVLTPPNDVYMDYGLCDDQFAVVKDIEDPDKQGRVRVQFNWQSGDDMSPFLDCSQVYAGKGRGFYFVPEVDDIVICGFLNNNPNMPYVKGSVYRKEQTIPADEVEKDNSRKMIRLNKHMMIELNEKTTIDGKTTPILAMASVDDHGVKKNFVVIGQDGETGVKIKSKEHTIYIEGDKIKIQSHGDMQIIADGDIAFNAGGGIKMKSQKGPISMDPGTQDIKISGMNIELKASASFKAEGTATAEMKGAQTTVKGDAMLDLNGGAMAQLQGGIVKIN